MASVLETTRSLHEEIERQIESAVSELSTLLTARHSSLQRDLIVKERLKQISTSISQLNSIYSDPDGLYKSDIIKAIKLDGQNAFHEFDGLAKTLISRYIQGRKNQLLNQDGSTVSVNNNTSSNTNGFNGLLYKQIVDLNDVFTPQEVRGKCLDLEPFHQKFTSLLITTLTAAFQHHNTVESLKNSYNTASNNVTTMSDQSTTKLPYYLNNLTPTDLHKKLSTHLKSLPTIHYHTYLTFFDDVSLLIPTYIKQHASLYVLNEYKDYLESLNTYLYTYLLRLNPFAQDDGIQEDIWEEYNTLNQDNVLLTKKINWNEVVNHRQSKSYGIPLIDYPLWNLNGLTDPTITTQNNNDNADGKKQEEEEEQIECKICSRSFPSSAYANHLTTKSHQTRFNKAVKLNPMLAFSTAMLSTPASSTIQKSSSSSSTTTTTTTAMGDDNTTTPPKTSHSSTPSLVITSGVVVTPQYLLTLQRSKKNGSKNEQEEEKFQKIQDQILKFEFSIGILTDLLRNTVTYTLQRAERRLTQTIGESTMDDIESEDETPQDPNDPTSISTDPSTTITNHSPNMENRLMTPDGRVIPPWLYKLHEFHMIYSCEICGGDIHRGERNFKRHFKEYKHLYMLKCLGIASDDGEVNNDIYMDISKIQEVLDLHAMIKKIAKQEGIATRPRGNQPPQAFVGEEFEDVLGNVTRHGE